MASPAGSTGAPSPKLGAKEREEKRARESRARAMAKKMELKKAMEERKEPESNAEALAGMRDLHPELKNLARLQAQQQQVYEATGVGGVARRPSLLKHDSVRGSNLLGRGSATIVSRSSDQAGAGGARASVSARGRSSLVPRASLAFAPSAEQIRVAFGGKEAPADDAAAGDAEEAYVAPQASILDSNYVAVRRLCNRDHPWRKRWDLAVMIVISLDFLMTPFLAAFNQHYSRAGRGFGVAADRDYFQGLVVGYVVDCFLLVDMGLQGITIIYDVRWGIVDTVDELRRRYVRSWRFVVDAAACLPWEVVALTLGRGPNSLLFSQLRMSRVVRIYRVRETLQRWGLNIRMNSNAVGIVNCVFFIVFASHFVACVWFWLAYTSSSTKRDVVQQSVESLLASEPNTWLDLVLDWQDMKTSLLYVKSLYWTMSTMTTVGYGAAKGRDVPNFEGSSLGRVPLVSADAWTRDRFSERLRRADAFSLERARAERPRRSDVESPVRGPGRLRRPHARVHEGALVRDLRHALRVHPVRLHLRPHGVARREHGRDHGGLPHEGRLRAAVPPLPERAAGALRARAPLPRQHVGADAGLRRARHHVRPAELHPPRPGPPPLRRHAGQEKSDMIISVPLFKNAEPAFVRAIVLRLLPTVFPENEKVVLKGEVGREMFFIQRGHCEVVNDETGEMLVELQDGQYFGEVSILCEARRTATVRSVTEVDLLVLNKQDLDLVCRDFPRVAAKMKDLADERRKIIGARVCKVLNGKKRDDAAKPETDEERRQRAEKRKLEQKLEEVSANTAKSSEAREEERTRIVGQTMVQAFKARRASTLAPVEEQKADVQASVMYAAPKPTRVGLERMSSKRRLSAAGGSVRAVNVAALRQAPKVAPDLVVEDSSDSDSGDDDDAPPPASPGSTGPTPAKRDLEEA